MFRDRELKKLAEYFVLLQVNKKKYPDVHRKSAQYVKGKYYPSKFEFVFCDSSGEEIEGTRLKGIGKLKDFGATMKAALEKTGRGVLKSVYVECKSAFDKAEALFKAGNYSDCVKIFEKLAKKKTELSFIEKAKTRLAEIDEKGKQLLQRAKEAVEKEDYESALQALFTLTVCFSKLPIKSDAQAELNKLKGLEGVAEAYKEAENIAKARKIYIQAETFLIEGNTRRAVTYYKKLVRGYEDTEYAEKAEERLAGLE